MALSSLTAGGTGPKGEYHTPSKVNGSPHSTLLNINSFVLWASDNGMIERDPRTLRAGVTFPRAASTVMLAGGTVWGGQVHDGQGQVVRIGGDTYGEGTRAGRIVAPGITESPDDPGVRIYRIRPDWASADLTQDASDIFGIPSIDITPADIARLRDMYKRDWLEWPWRKGAPYYEKNGLPGYQPSPDGLPDTLSDEPGLGGADQVIWFVTNDLDGSATAGLYGSQPIGLEIQTTLWAYNHIDSLRNIVFERQRLIYKGTAVTPPTARIDSMYIAKWADPDVGDYSDDEVGYLVDRQVAYAYNSQPHDAEYDKFRLVPPIVGYDYLQGPRIPAAGKSARWNLTSVAGYDNLPVNAFTYFTAETRTTDVSLGGGAGSWYNILRGYKPAPISPPQCMIDPISNNCTTFELTGDPQNFAGWVDGLQEAPGDRRFMVSSGPFSLAFGDTQEVVVALIGAIGSDNRDLPAFERVDDAAQDAWRVNFNFPAAVPPPGLRIVELDGKLILDWESDTAAIRRSESYSSQGFRFETYRIYQYKEGDTLGANPLLYQVCNPAAERYVYLTGDKIRPHALVDGQKYFFAVTTVAFNPDPSLERPRIESKAVIHECTPHKPNPGVVYSYAVNEVVSDARNIVGDDDASVTTTMYDPDRPDGRPYKVLFHRSSDPLKDIDEKPRWDLIDSSTHDTLIAGLLSDGPAQRVIGRGFTIQVQLPVHGIRKIFQSEAGGRRTDDPVFNTADPGGHYMFLAPGSSDIDTIKGESLDDIDVEFRFNGDSSWALFRGANVPQSRWVRVPYTAWRVGHLGNDTVNSQIYTAVTKFGGDSVWRPSVLLDREYNGRTMKEFYPVSVIVDSQLLGPGWYGGKYYDDAPTRTDAAYIKGFVWTQSIRQSNKLSVVEAYIADLDEDGSPAPPGTIVRFTRWKEVKNADEKIFVPAAVKRSDREAALAAVQAVNVFPNPYYGFNRAEQSRTKRFVTFNHLPAAATIRIFTITGDLVKTIGKDDPSQFAEWDLNNENGLPAGGGIYLAHVTLGARGELGEKILKLMIVPEDLSPKN